MAIRTSAKNEHKARISTLMQAIKKDMLIAAFLPIILLKNKETMTMHTSHALVVARVIAILMNRIRLN